MKYIYFLLILVPVAVVLELIDAPAFAIFSVSALALIPLAAVLGKATEELAVHTGPKIGGLLNATLGNAAELIITIVALKEGLVELVKASITGSILGNILVVLGASLLLGGLKNGIQRFDRSEAGVVSTLLVLSIVALTVPTIFASSIEEEGHQGVLYLSDGVAITMIVLYIAYLAYSIFNVGRPSTADSTLAEHSPTEHGAAGVAVAGGGSGMAHVVGQSMAPTAGEVIVRPERQPAGGGSGHGAGHGGGHGAGHHTATWSLPRALVVLVVSTIAIVFMSEFLVGAVHEVVRRVGWTEVFLGVMIIPLVGNVAEHIVGVQVAYKNQMDLSLAISLGSSLQVALFVAPVLVFISLFVGPEQMDLVFTPFEIIALLGTVAVAAFVSLDGESNWLEGVMLLGVYVILGIAFFFLPV